MRRQQDRGSPCSSQGSPTKRKRDGGQQQEQEAHGSGEGIAKERQRDTSADVLKTEESLSKRFSEERIEVYDWEILNCAFLLHSPHGTKTIKVIQRHDGHAIPEEFREKWNNIKDDSILAEMKYIESKMSTTAEMMRFDIEGNARNWKCEVPAVTEEEKVEKTRKRRKGDQRWNKPANTQIDVLIDTLTYQLQTRMVSALVHGMKNSKGRRFMESVLALASRICFGPTWREKCEVMGVGTSNVKHEGFPMSLVSEDAVTDYDFTGQNVSDDWDSSFDKRLPSGAATKSIAHGRIFPDCVVASMSDFARYLIVAEVKHSNSGWLEMAQLYREMIGAGVHQSEVFGIIVTSSQACILRMTFCDPRRTILLFSKKEYSFGSFESDGYLRDSFLNFFRDLIAVLDYGSKHIVEVSHFERPIEAPLAIDLG